MGGRLSQLGERPTQRPWQESTRPWSHLLGAWWVSELSHSLLAAHKLAHVTCLLSEGSPSFLGWVGREGEAETSVRLAPAMSGLGVLVEGAGLLVEGLQHAHPIGGVGRFCCQGP